ncbi:ABC transporter ATP-binding protein [Trueperella bialowiezensis]|uniref:Fe(3+) ions import ATP-binding protein FbpC 2 n=1 Tax=Trueperella bialowiezensis TaxID=312285 RepID=A0A448PF59_9ACTO|nr:ABC transporter ATP-binding protein [Trueperella bialowiezensis]VEI13538.1 Fe(3+) ions import ATP-binding protein FbpC 2 [Trueperella bialowiezensis]
MLELKNVTVTYDEPPVRAVNDLSMRVDTGEIVALLGESGSGKSSLLRAVAGLEPADGEVFINGTNVAGVPVHRRGVGMVFQDGQLFPHRNVARNISYGLEIPGHAKTGGDDAGSTGSGRGVRGRRLPKSERAARVAELLDLVGLAGYENRPITTLSGGQAQRVALARTLAPQPEVVLLDEPLSALDRILRTRLSSDLRRILTSVKATALYVTHDREEALAIADRVAIMDGGRLVQIGTAEQLLREPASDVVVRLLT